MIWNDLSIAATASWLPPAVGVEEPLASGAYDPEDAERQDYTSVTVAGPGENVADMWSRAARLALSRSDFDVDGVDLLLCAGTFGAGVDGWNAAAYVQRELGMTGGLAVEVRGGSNGGLAALELAASFLTRPGANAAVITAGDLFPAPYFDRWRAERFLFGDGCAAAVLSTGEGYARLVATASTSDPSLEAMHRGDTPIGPFDPDKKFPIDLRERAKEFQAGGMAKEEIFKRLSAGPRVVVRQVLAESGVTLDEIEHMIVPHFGRTITMLQCLFPLGLRDIERTTWDFARSTGHLGPADQLAALNHLHENGQLKHGQYVLMLGVGAGFSWSSALLQIADI
ncbi:ketoacyl-ACP synthase III family protein [Actinoallomurus rhizosphaericola]|uniref:ketoacyl-ACP synthase III family protein n=1 Tax=Actinoallomurus rhizosphaericola TaxID=2952536 RepID=UPI0020930077|nr:ketoacyl-ACP synthase III family protein [Actinoallomurus rhizosphaericola]MCO5995870.1 ketoacyl-ACP synthase III family protein [Actinoallomurus rhizosphaericola]